MRILKHLSATWLPFFAVLWGGAFVVVLAATFFFSIWNNISISGWSIAAAQVSRWVAFWIGVYLINTLMSIAVAHGRTRREFLGQAAMLTVVVSGVIAVLSRLGFLVEALVYGAMGWDTAQAGAGILEYWLMYAVWTAVGAFIAGAFIRFSAGGLLSIPIGILLIIPAGSLVSGANALPFLGELPSYSSGSALVTFSTFVIALGLAWSLARDLPIRVKAA